MGSYCNLIFYLETLVRYFERQWCIRPLYHWVVLSLLQLRPWSVMTRVRTEQKYNDLALQI